MRIKWMILIAVAVLAMPASASATVSPTDYKNAAKFCKALRADMGTEAFKQAYGTNKNKRNAYGKCVSKHARTVDAIHSDAVKACKAEREATNAKGSLVKCVSEHSDEATQAKHDAIVNAAKTCKSERTADPAAFREKYGTNKNKRNAFGKCVVQHVRASQEADSPA